jgi:tetratricopeptide (TPR) repeat protein
MEEGESGVSEIDLKANKILTLLDHGPFVGRGTKMSKLIEIYTRVREGQTWIISIKGESGIGKTRMATEFLDWARMQGATVLQGRAFEDGGRWPYQPLIEMLEHYRGHRMRRRHIQRTMPDPLHEMLDRVIEEMRSYVFNQSGTNGQGKTEYKRLFESFTLLGQALAEQTPVILFIDDIHWSDFASLEMLQYAGRCWIESNTPVLLLLSLRTEALVILPTFAGWLARLEHDLHASSFILNPLLLEDTIEFVCTIAAEETVQLEGFGRWLFSETGGQAFYIVELLKMLFDYKMLKGRERENGRWEIDFETIAGNIGALERLLLPGVRAVIAMQLKQLSPTANQLAAAGAVLGRYLPFEYLCYVAHLTEEEGREALKELLARHIFCEEDTHYFFTHDKVREVIYMETARTQRIELHSRALETLHIEAIPVSFQAYHARSAGFYGQAFHLYVAAGDAVVRFFALRDGIAFYERALHLLLEQPMEGTICAEEVPVATIEHIYLQAGHVYELLHERERAWATYQSMFLLAKRMHITMLISVALSQLAMVSWHEVFDMQEQARMLFQEEIGHVDDKSVLIENAWQLAQFNFYRFEAEAALQNGKQALQLARESGSPELIARALSAFASALMLVNAWEEVEARAEEVRVFYENQHNPVLEATCLVQIAQARYHLGQPQECIIAVRAAHHAFTQADYSWGRIYSAYHLIAGLLDIGAYEEALLAAEEALALARVYNAALLLCLCLIALGRVRRALMDPTGAYALHHEAMSIFSTDIPRLIMELLVVELCADCVLAGEWAEAQSYATQALSYRGNSTFLYVGLTRWQETEILVRTGYNEPATTDAEQLGHLCNQSPRYRIPYLRSLAVLALWRGEFEQTDRYLQEAGEMAEEIGLPGELWSIEATRGELFLAQGNKAEARAAFEHASKIVYALADRIENGQVRAKFLAAHMVQRTRLQTKWGDENG